MVRHKTATTIGALVSVALIPGVAMARGDGDRDVPIAGLALERAVAIALAHIGDGRVTSTEVGDEDSYYEVEVTLGDGRQIDVQLDEQFNVVGSKSDRSDNLDD
ncbi:MAG: PepSY domain-containing protein [Acidimicrobiia bacterium]|nr:PepSY domain-containing protein [Acidimicrobiia bacterium]MDH4308428.1 PepSY domain-containing protein [Acidimicrobiia bacterium]MDH5292201.1 PepSY domain-containing protein [Acidimicrobiia bacterium]